MGKFLVILGILILVAIIWVFPLYFCVNLVLLLFHIPYHLTFLQAIGICLLISTIKSICFRKGDD